MSANLTFTSISSDTESVSLENFELPGTICRRQYPSGELLFVSPEVQALTGYTPAQLMAGDVLYADLIHDDDRTQVELAIETAIQSDSHWQVQYRIRHAKLGVRWVAERGHAVRVLSPNRLVLDAFVYDLTEQKETELKLKSTESQYRALVMNMSTGLIVHDGQTRILYSNPAARRFLSLTEKQLLGKEAFDPGWRFLRGDGTEMPHEEFPAIWVATHKEALHQQQVGVVQHEGAQIRWGLVEAYPEFEQGQLQRIIVTFIDISTQKQAEQDLERLNDQLEIKVVERTAALLRANQELERAMEQLVQSEKLASLGALVAGVSHELNTPLGNSLVVVSSLKDQLTTLQHALTDNQLSKSRLQHAIDEFANGIQLIQQSSQRAADLVASFKQVAVDQASERRRRFALRELLDDVLQSLSPMFRQQPVEFTIDVPDDLEMDSYPGPIEQILSNLIQNSLVHGFSEPTELPYQIRITAQTQGDSTQIEYQDNGKGMTAEVLSHAFDPFYTTRLGQGGSGLGLYIVYNQVTSLLQGKVTLESTVGAGCRFLLNIPTQAS